MKAWCIWTKNKQFKEKSVYLKFNLADMNRVKGLFLYMCKFWQFRRNQVSLQDKKFLRRDLTVYSKIL